MISHKSIVVTGASGGIGKSIIDELVKDEGTRILAACRRADVVTGCHRADVVGFFLPLSGG